MSPELAAVVAATRPPLGVRSDEQAGKGRCERGQPTPPQEGHHGAEDRRRYPRPVDAKAILTSGAHAARLFQALRLSIAPAFTNVPWKRGLKAACASPTLRIVRTVALAATGLALLLAVGGAAASSSDSRGGATVSGGCPNGKRPATSVTKIQGIQLDLLRRSSFNNLNGRQVAGDLLSHRRLWCAALIDRLGTDALIKLRDLDENAWNADTLYVLSSRQDDRALARLARRWHADAITWVGGAAASRLLGDSSPARILEVWWD